MLFFSSLLDARHTILSNKMRSGLSALGIIIGVSSVVIMLSIGAGAQHQLTSDMGSMVANSVDIVTTNSDASKVAKKLKLNDDTISYLETTFPELSGKIAANTSASKIAFSYANDNANGTLNGISDNYFVLSKEKMKYGSGFTASDFINGSRVVILNYGSLDTIFDNSVPLGKIVTIKGKPFSVVGILDQTALDKMGGGMVTAYIPQTTFVKDIRPAHEYDSLTVYFDTDQDNETRRQLIYSSLLKYLGVSRTKDANFDVSSFANFVETIQKSLQVFSMFLVAIGGISLVVGGIGVMNIMIVSVTERTREIGIRKAIGALRKDIILQFLTESIVITLLGGVIAVVFSIIVVVSINALIALGGPESPVANLRLIMNPGVIVLALFITALTGIVFGILPARKAAHLKPIDALRFE